jgi:hypothetical protein
LILIEMPATEFPGKLLNVNSQRGHSRVYGRLADPWRKYGKRKALALGVEALETPVVIWAHFRFADNRRRDTSNLYPTLKALVDGFVDAGLIPDDCDGVIHGPHLQREYPNGSPRLLVTLQSVGYEALGLKSRSTLSKAKALGTRGT